MRIRRKILRRLKWVAVALVIAGVGWVYVALTGSVAGETTTAVVVTVVDGDTIDVQDATGKHRVRLIGIDTPEIGRGGNTDECYAQEARTALNELVYGQQVELRADPTQDDTDRYGRQLRHVYLEGESVAFQLIEQGFAHEYTYDKPYQGSLDHLRAEAQAIATGAGLWGRCAGN